jgi:hypothetical protein
MWVRNTWVRCLVARGRLRPFRGTIRRMVKTENPAMLAEAHTD